MKRSEVVLEGQKYPRDGVERENRMAHEGGSGNDGAKKRPNMERKSASYRERKY